MDFLFITETIFTSGLPVCLIALGIFLTFRLLDFADMTAEGSFLIAAAITVVGLNNGLNPLLVIILAMLGGAACGALTGVLNRFLKVPKLLSGIITMTACGGIVYFIMGYDSITETFRGSVQLNPRADTIYKFFYNLNTGIPNPVIEILVMLFFVVAVMFAIYFFFGTEYGMAIRSTGMNEKMARAQGINATICTIVCIAISNALIALGACLIFQEGGQVRLGIESGRLVVGLAAVLIGEAIFGKRSFKNWLISVALGAIVYYAIITLVLNVGSEAYRNAMDSLKKLIYALLITLALCLPMIKNGILSLIEKHKKKKTSESEVKA